MPHFPSCSLMIQHFLYTVNNLNTLAIIINTELIKTDEWLKCNNLSIHIKKTHDIIFSSKNKLLMMINNLRLTLNQLNEFILQSSWVSSWIQIWIGKSISNMFQRKYQNPLVSCVKLANYWINPRSVISTIHLYTHIIYMVYKFGEAYLQKLVLLQKKAIIAITCSKYMASTQNLFKQYKLLRLPEIYKYLVGIFVYKFDNMQLPMIFSGFYTKAWAVHAHVTCTADSYCLINIKLNVWKHSLKFSGSAIWNMIPMCIRLSKSLEIFKNI